LAVVKALQHWRHWLEGTAIPLDIITDHKNLEYFTKPHILNRRQLQWMDLLKHYNYTIGYRPGHQNGVADALSRRQELAPENPEEEPTTMIPPERMAQLAEIAELTWEEYNECLVALIEEQIRGDTEIQQEIRDTIMEMRMPDTVVVHKGLPYHRDQIYVPDN
jgi:RNase H-like domain found in reverse transcriptase